MKRLIFLVVVVVVSIPGLSCADQGGTKTHLEEIARLSQELVTRDFAPVTIVTTGVSAEDAITKAAIKARKYIGLKGLSIDLCKCLESFNFIPKEECELLKNANFSVEKAEDGTETVTFVFKLDSSQLKQLALFGLWPLFDKKLRGSLST